MNYLWRFTVSAIACMTACGPSGDVPAGRDAPSRAMADSEQCDILTAADVQAVTGTSVERMDRNPAVGAGGTCVNFAGADGQVYLGVNRLNSTSEYRGTVGAVPEDVYPDKQALPGLGDEAVLFKGPGGVRFLVARKSTSGVVLFPLGEGYNMSDQQLRDLAAKALASGP